MKRYVFASILMSIVALEISAFEPDMIIKINYDNRDIAYSQLKPLRLVYEDVQSSWARALVKQDQLEKVKSLGFKVDILYQDSRDRAAEWKRSMGEKWTGYSALVTELQSIASAHSDICRLHNIGKSVQNRDIYVMEITDLPDTDETNEAEVRIIGNIHGDEYVSLELMRRLIQYLTDNYGSLPAVTNLVDNREIWVQPSVNPDGHENGSRYNYHGVDLNRNHGYMYDSEGSGPFSEIELQNFRTYSLQRNFSMSLSFHGETTYFNYCWNFTGENAWDKTYLQSLGNRYNDWNGYTVIEGYDWYQTNGDTNDWSYGCRGDFDITIETPGYSESAIDTDWNNNRDAILYIIEQAAYGISGIVTDATSGEPLEALVTVHQKPIMVYTDPEVGDFHRPLQAGTYDMTVWANGHAAATFNSIVVTTSGITAQDVQLLSNGQFHAMHVCYNEPDSYYVNTADSWYGIWPHQALGPPDDVPGSLGRNSSLVLDMGSGFEITNHSGDDLIVYEAAVGDGNEGFTLQGSTSGFLGPWVFIGTGTGTVQFDLSISGLTSVRYLRFIDDGDGSYNIPYPGYDLDAVAALPEMSPTPSPTGPTPTPTVTQPSSPTPLPASILLIDDDAGENYETYYESALTNTGKTYDVWTVSSQGNPSASVLSLYSVVIWFTGDDYSSTLTSADQTNLTTYLNSGGKLFISGQDIGYDIRTDAFYASYLHSSYVVDDTDITSLTGLDIFSGHSISIAGGDGADNQTYPSQITAVNGGTACWQYAANTFGGIRYSGTYCLVYFAWGFEGISTQADRNTILTTVLSFFDSCGAVPTATASVTPVPTNTATRSPTATRTPTSTSTAPATATPSYSPTRTATAVASTATMTAIPTNTASPTPSPTRTSTGTSVPVTATATSSPMATASPSTTPGATMSPSPTSSRTATSTPTSTGNPSATVTSTGTPLPLPANSTGGVVLLMIIFSVVFYCVQIKIS